MSRQLGWVWFGGREYKIVIFYLTEDNDVFCRENDDAPVKLCESLPKRINLGLSATASGDFLEGGASSFGINDFGFHLHESISLDDYRSLTPWINSGYINYYLPNYKTYIENQEYIYDNTSNNDLYRYESSLTIDMDSTLSSIAGSTQISFGSRIFDPLGFSQQFNTQRTGTLFWPNQPWTFLFFDYDFGYTNNPNSFRLAVSGGSGSGTISSISNTWGFAAKVLAEKTVFAVTSGVAIDPGYIAYKGHITTGTLENFNTYNLPNEPTIDSDLPFQITFGPTGNFSKFINMYQSNGVTSQIRPYQIKANTLNINHPSRTYGQFSISWPVRKPGPILICNPYSEDHFTISAYGQGTQEDLEEKLKDSSTFELQIYNSQIHTIFNSTTVTTGFTVPPIDEIIEVSVVNNSGIPINGIVDININNYWSRLAVISKAGIDKITLKSINGGGVVPIGTTISNNRFSENTQTAGDFDTVTIPGLPANTKRILGILSCPT
jgi:hypothetical protein